MVNFLLILEKIIEYDKKIIDKGLTPQKVYGLCSCIREVFCLSYSIRKNNILYLYFQKEHVLVKFEGVNTLLLSRLMGIDPEQATLDWIGMELKPQFLRNSKIKPTDVYFIPA